MLEIVKSEPGGEEIDVDGDVDVADAFADATAARLVADRKGRTVSWNAPAEPFVGLLGESDRLAGDFATWIAAGASGVLTLDVSQELGAVRYAMQAVKLAGGQHFLVLISPPDVNAHLITALSASRQLYKDLLSCAQAFAWETDKSGRFNYVSGAEIVGYETAKLSGQRAERFFQLGPDLADRIFRAEDPLDSADIWFKRGDGRRICMHLSVRPLIDANGTWRGTRGMAFDVTTEREQADALEVAHARLRSLAESDSLTGLFNRRAFDGMLRERLRARDETSQGGALMLIDLDHFKLINDTLGHQAGDAVLTALGKGLLAAVRNNDIAARIGGDEFVVWLEGVDLEAAQRIAERLLGLRHVLKEAAGAPQAPLSLSIGLAMAKAGEDMQALTARADDALYKIKKAGRDGFAIAEDSPDDFPDYA